MRARFLTSLVILALVLFGPYWLYLPALVVGVLAFNIYWEGVIFAILIDVLYSIGSSFFLGYTVTVGIVFLFIVSPLIKKRLRFSQI